jgi:hypothetical protein
MFSIEACIGTRHGLLEGVEVDHQQVDATDAVLVERAHVLGKVATGEQSAVDLRVQRLHAAVEHLRETGVLGHFGHGEPLFGKKLRGAAGGQEVHAQFGERAGEVDDSGLVRHADQRAQRR